jgi:arginine decarboxylase
MARIENFNILQYTSVLPPEAEEVPYDDVKHLIHHGAALETIMANMNGR